MWPKQFVCIFSSLLNFIIFNVPPKTTIQSNPGRIKIDNNDFTGVEKWRPPELRAWQNNDLTCLTNTHLKGMYIVLD
jgi:hypothetical protein